MTCSALTVSRRRTRPHLPSFGPRSHATHASTPPVPRHACCRAVPVRLRRRRQRHPGSCHSRPAQGPGLYRQRRRGRHGHRAALHRRRQCQDQPARRRPLRHAGDQRRRARAERLPCHLEACHAAGGCRCRRPRGGRLSGRTSLHLERHPRRCQRRQRARQRGARRQHPIRHRCHQPAHQRAGTGCLPGRPAPQGLQHHRPPPSPASPPMPPP